VVYTADSIRKFDSKSNRTADSIRMQKKDLQVPNKETFNEIYKRKENTWLPLPRRTVFCRQNLQMRQRQILAAVTERIGLERTRLLCHSTVTLSAFSNIK